MYGGSGGVEVGTSVWDCGCWRPGPGKSMSFAGDDMVYSYLGEIEVCGRT